MYVLTSDRLVFVFMKGCKSQIHSTSLSFILLHAPGTFYGLITIIYVYCNLCVLWRRLWAVSCSMGPLSPRHGTSSCWGRRRRHAGTQGSCEYIQESLAYCTTERGQSSNLRVGRVGWWWWGLITRTENVAS